MLHQLLVGVLVQADQHVQGRGAVRDQVAVDLVGQDEIQEQFGKTSHLLVDRSITDMISHHVATQHLDINKQISLDILIKTYMVECCYFNGSLLV